MPSMNSEKLLALLKILEQDEDDYSVQTSLTGLIEAINQNNASIIEEKKEEVISLLKQGRARDFAPSEVSVLKKINGERFFGLLGVEEIRGYFDSELYKLKENLANYRQDRKIFISFLLQTISSLENMNFKPHVETDKYEVGIILPDNYLTLDKTVEALSTWNKFLNTLSDVKKVDKDCEISIVSQGSLELYVLASLSMAKAINLLLVELVDMYEKIAFIRKKEEELKVLKNKTIQEELKTERDEIENNFVKEVTDALVKDVKFVDDSEKNLATSQLSGQVKKIFRMHKDGVTLEIHPPKSESYEDLTESQQEKKDKESKVFLETNQKVLNSNIELSRLLLKEDDSKSETEK